MRNDSQSLYDSDLEELEFWDDYDIEVKMIEFRDGVKMLETKAEVFHPSSEQNIRSTAPPPKARRQEIGRILLILKTDEELEFWEEVKMSEPPEGVHVRWSKIINIKEIPAREKPENTKTKLWGSPSTVTEVNEETRKRWIKEVLKMSKKCAKYEEVYKLQRLCKGGNVELLLMFLHLLNKLLDMLELITQKSRSRDCDQTKHFSFKILRMTADEDSIYVLEIFKKLIRHKMEINGGYYAYFCKPDGFRECMHMLYCRYRKQFSWAVPNHTCINEIVNFVNDSREDRKAKILEVGCGNGLWGALLKGYGIKVIATDDYSWQEYPWTIESYWTDIKRISVSKACEQFLTDVLLICYPPLSEMGYNAVKCFKGNKIIHICESSTEEHTRALAYLLNKYWWRVSSIRIRSFPTLRTHCNLYMRK